MDIFINPLFYRYYQKYPIKLIDVGAKGGLQSNWKNVEKYLQVVGFEPDNRAFRDLEKNASPKRIYINKALYEHKGAVDFHVTKKEGNSSIFIPNRTFLEQFPDPGRFDVSKISKIEVDSIDNQLKKHTVEDVDFIKVDAQGADLSILKGSVKTLENVFGLEIEVEFSRIYEKQPLFSDVDQFVRGFGFQFFDLKPYYWKRKAGKKYGGPKGQLIFANALYLLGLNDFRKRLDRVQDDMLLKSKILKFITVALLYGYADYALEICEREKKVFSEKEAELLFKEIRKKKSLSARMPRFPGMGRIARLFKKLYNILRYSYNGWATNEEFLGNLD